MALNRFSIHIGAKGKATPHFNYITAQGRYEHKTGVEYIRHGNMPDWAKDDPSKFWAAADEYERANGQTYKEQIVSIPRELPESERSYFIGRWVRRELGDKHPYTFAIHCTKSSDGDINPHAHIMFSTRELDGIDRPPEQFFKRYNAKNPEQGGAKKAETGISRGEMKKNLVEQRERWLEHLHGFAYRYGYTVSDRPSPHPENNKTMAEIQKAQKLDTMLEQHPWYISPEPVPKFVPAPPPPAPTPEPIRTQGETLAEKYARENAENARIHHETTQTTPTPPPRPQTPQRENTGYDYDFGM